MLTRHQWSLSLLLINDSIFEALPGRVRGVLMGIGRDLAGHVVDFAVCSEQSYLEKLRQNSVVTIAPVDIPSFMKAFEGMAESLSEAPSMTRALERILCFR